MTIERAVSIRDAVPAIIALCASAFLTPAEALAASDLVRRRPLPLPDHEWQGFELTKALRVAGMDHVPRTTRKPGLEFTVATTITIPTSVDRSRRHQQLHELFRHRALLAPASVNDSASSDPRVRNVLRCEHVEVVELASSVPPDRATTRFQRMRRKLSTLTISRDRPPPHLHAKEVDAAEFVPMVSGNHHGGTIVLTDSQVCVTSSTWSGVFWVEQVKVRRASLTTHLLALP